LSVARIGSPLKAVVRDRIMRSRMSSFETCCTSSADWPPCTACWLPLLSGVSSTTSIGSALVLYWLLPTRTEAAPMVKLPSCCGKST